MKFSVVRKIEFDAGHRVPYHKSKCYNLHGHRYKVEVEVEGEIVEEGYEKDMVMDFGDIKQEMMEFIHNNFDHSFMIWNKDEILPEIQELTIKMNFKVNVLPFVPTAEKLAEYFFIQLSWRINNNTRKVKSVVVWETPNSKAIYREGD